MVALSLIWKEKVLAVPLRCLDPAGRGIHSFDLSDEEWQALLLENRVARHLRMPCCPSQVTLRASRLGTRFFAHKARGTCTSAPETVEHLLLKQMAVSAGRANGWTVETEAADITPSGEPWRADVLAQKGRHKVAVEIQWSYQANEETLRRQKRYAQSGVRCLWLFRQPQFPTTRDLPAARIGGNLEQGLVALGLPMREFLNAAFSGRFRFGSPFTLDATVSIMVGHLDCWSCGAETKLITGINVRFGPSEFIFTVADLGEYTELFRSVHSKIPGNLGIGRIMARFSKTQERYYMSNGCVHCGSLIGEFHEHDAWEDQERVCTFPIQMPEECRQVIEERCGKPGWWVCAEP